MGEKKLTLEEFVEKGYTQMLNPTKLSIVLILYAAEKLEEMKLERKLEAEG